MTIVLIILKILFALLVLTAVCACVVGGSRMDDQLEEYDWKQQEKEDGDIF